MIPDQPQPAQQENGLLRPEARPLPYADLDRQQQAAFGRVVELLSDAVTRVPSARRPSPTGSIAPLPTGPFLEHERSSRHVLVSGERGTGKTTLLLSLAHALAAGREGNDEATLDSTLRPGLLEQVRTLRRRLVWLETLDMEPLASEANLLGAVLARVEAAVGARFPGVEGAPETTSLLYPGPGFHDVTRELVRLQTSVALTFGGNLGERAGSLDPDTFAVESRRTERERLGLDRRFASVLAGLSAVLAGAVELKSPVFVLPVDDVDLNIADCVRLLRLLRAASSPHLLVVMAADVALLSTVLRLMYQGELARLSGPRDLAPEDQQVAADLAANALRKHLPPSQRVVLDLIDPAEALTLRPIGAVAPRLGDLLGRVVLPTDEARLQLDPTFASQEVASAVEPVTTSPAWSIKGKITEGRLAAVLGPYSWPTVLRQPLRRVVDLYLECLAQTGHGSEQPRTTHSHADSPLTQLALEKLQAGRPDSVSRDFIEVHPRPHLWRAVDDVPEVEILAWHGWTVSQSGAHLTSAESEAIVGCLEIAGDTWYASQGNNGSPLPQVGSARQTRWSVAQPPSPTPDPNQVRPVFWPWVTHTTFWAYERAFAWLAEADAKWKPPYAPFGAWIAVMTAQLFDAPTGAQPFDRPTKPLAEDWPTLEKRLVELPGGTQRDAWLDIVGLLCTPEMGMTDIEQIQWPLPSDRTSQVQDLRDARTKGLPASVKSRVARWSPIRPKVQESTGDAAVDASNDDGETVKQGAQNQPKKRPPSSARSSAQGTGATDKT